MQRRQFVHHAGRAALLAATTPLFTGQALANEAPGVSARTITIGCSAPLSGPLVDFGKDIQTGAGAAFAEANARGGVHGRSVQLNILDDGYQPERSVTNVRKFIAEGGALALLSCVGTPNNTETLPLVEEAGLPHVAPITGATSLRKNARSVFHVRASYGDEMLRLVNRLTDMGLKGIGIVYLDNGYGREMLEVGTRALAAKGMQPAVQTALATDGKNLAQVLAAVAKARPAAVLLATAGTVSVGLVHGLKKDSPGLLMAGLSVSLPSSSLAGLGEDARGLALTMVVPDPASTKLAVVREYQAAMRAGGFQGYTQGSLEAYINARVLLEGLERAGKDPTPARLRSALAGIRDMDVGGFKVGFGAQPPFVGSRYVELGVLGAAGRFIG
ncbi:ABC transporter substrate-binding protein [Oryzisolibacter sp. LB2S]|uniref:ABC transporter substrate-binding protein n=1 Tax=Alicycliphilus soli TaxID=3228789 RepID=UPI00345A251C